MSIKIDNVFNELDSNNKFTITGKISVNKYYKVEISFKNKLLYKIDEIEKSNEANFNVIIPKDNRFWKIKTDFRETAYHIKNNINEKDLKKTYFPYRKYNIPPEIWTTIYGSIYADL
jgi:hypothetical protein